MRRAATLLLLLLAAGSAAADTPPIRLQLSPKIGQAPQDVHVKVFVERSPANRWLTLAVDGPNYSRTTTWQLDGEASTRVFDVWRQGLPCGDYTVVAEVKRNDGSTSQVRDTFRLLGFACVSPDEPF